MDDANARTARTSGVEQDAMRLLEAFYDLADGTPNAPVSVGSADSPQGGAAERAGLEPEGTECAVALRYLTNQNYIKPLTGDPSFYTLNTPGIEQVRQIRGESPQTEERSGMSDKTQRRLVTLLAIALAMGLSKPITRYISEEIPERRGIKDDMLEAALQGMVRMVALFLASVVVRQVALRRR